MELQGLLQVPQWLVEVLRFWQFIVVKEPSVGSHWTKPVAQPSQMKLPPLVFTHLNNYVNFPNSKSTIREIHPDLLFLLLVALNLHIWSNQCTLDSHMERILQCEALRLFQRGTSKNKRRIREEISWIWASFQTALRCVSHYHPLAIFLYIFLPSVQSSSLVVRSSFTGFFSIFGLILQRKRERDFLTERENTLVFTYFKTQLMWMEEDDSWFSQLHPQDLNA